MGKCTDQTPRTIQNQMTHFRTVVYNRNRLHSCTGCETEIELFEEGNNEEVVINKLIEFIGPKLVRPNDCM